MALFLSLFTIQKAKKKLLFSKSYYLPYMCKFIVKYQPLKWLSIGYYLYNWRLLCIKKDILSFIFVIFFFIFAFYITPKIIFSKKKDIIMVDSYHSNFFVIIIIADQLITVTTQTSFKTLKEIIKLKIKSSLDDPH